ncbi:hypothetical protein SAMN06265337_2311 [Hymenobacter gelipurpurascens]|uniref:Uncharacterized protein n=1 Tax=Hymenobacter gelipurpurascens TaxID=89968 RepID=A0A212TRE2_9BACT|nr:anti-sigma factor [Hymenobacter gelipurpurascens]SNC68431.1 hypothetical protein SAMN06265337_2311 [Hymenobacter gelipurpurascens]
MKEEIEEGPEFGRIHLHKAIASLPQHVPAEQAWERIVQQLDFAAALDEVRHELPEHEPDELVWDNILAELDQEPIAEIQPVWPTPAVVRPMWPTARVLRVGAMAASWLLVLLAWHYWPSATPIPIATTERVSYSVETVSAPLNTTEEPLALPDDVAEEHEGMAFINAQCTKVPAGCQSPEFRSLKQQMAELDAEEKRLQQEVQRFGSNPELVRYQTRVTALKATVTKELIQLLIT